MKQYMQVVTTTDSRESAEKIAASAVEQRLAACVQITACRSVYRWQGKIEHADEFVCTMKSRADLYPELEKAIRQAHTYQVPEIIATEIKEGGNDYLSWMDEELRPKGGRGD